MINWSKIDRLETSQFMFVFVELSDGSCDKFRSAGCESRLPAHSNAVAGALSPEKEADRAKSSTRVGDVRQQSWLAMIDRG